MPALTHELIARTVPPSPPGPAAPEPDEIRLRAEMRVFLHDRDPRLGIWVFAYGGLMWNHQASNPDIVAPARLPGYARRYTLRDIRDRGTPGAPGLTLGLEEAPALACAGLLLHLPGPEAEASLWPIWKQEMAPGFYEPHWCGTVMHASRDAGGAPIRALSFISRHQDPLYVGELPVGAVADILAEASGPNGSAAGYLLDASETLRRHGMRDAMLESLEAEVARRLTSSRPRPPAPRP
ncbi:gamma-glutamylcyclotransferase [Roseomonas xinghualingensis]|uniref:gamma-glutamylcyclotransferase n=1 Tax=Roseomonas xinghualingensis TaxID=2986475 RepID=UPI0021F20A51|nr:gamma-glutamylcyclotransferase [Roseomonas sp. SXEYE001]MCV4207310.1 gamma-glutamylcyclotransferase [Roseomonas sp. SXEYE001]